MDLIYSAVVCCVVACALCARARKHSGTHTSTHEYSMYTLMQYIICRRDVTDSSLARHYNGLLSP